ncbi:sterol desaturase family protein [uncultured Microscilla sp.]|uniref:sterol desaturase family protein n=1 Tax=uncultured Microscilla sp. TaxID=432653 RepID=UPI002616B9F4|nr:sterol desaturase family protein [uncultured Microscilla sp.]
MQSTFQSVFDQISPFFLPIVFTLIIVELLLLWVGKKIKLKKESWVSLLCYSLGSLPYFLFFAVLQLKVMFWFYENARLFTLGNEWYVWVLAFVCFDFVWWVVHFAAHKVRFFWCIHGVHHTPKEMNMSVSIRGSVFDFVQYIHLMIWLPLLGFHPYIIFIMNGLSRIYAVFTHLNERYLKHTPLLDKFLITPSLHRVHHSSNHLYIDTNFANTLSIWDRIFRTYQSEVAQVKPVFGVMDKDLNTESVLSSQFDLWKSLIRDIKATPKITDKIKYLVMPPGWHPQNKGKTAKIYRDSAMKTLDAADKAKVEL